MPMGTLLAAKMGRPDYAGSSGASLSLVGQDVLTAGPVPTVGVSSDVTIGRMGLTILLIAIGAIAISYVATRTRQF